MKVFLLFFLLALPGCATVKVWDQGFPRSAKELPTHAEKVAEFDKFAMSSMYMDSWGGGGVKTVTAKEKEVYTLESFKPVVTAVSPSTEAMFEATKKNDFWQDVSSALTFPALLACLYSGSQDARAVAGATFVVATGMGFYFNSQDARAASDIKTQYHRDLNRTIYGEKSAATRHAGKLPSAGFVWKLD